MALQPGAAQDQLSAAPDQAETGRSERRRQAIIRAATEVFVRHGYLGATTDEVAARASVSKQTLYKHFADKQHLFAEVILDASVQVVDGLSSAVASTLDDAPDVRQGLRALADGFLRGLLQPDVLRLRRLVIAEADRFPEIGRAWFDRGFNRALVILGEAMRRLADRGLLQGLADPALAAYQFAGLVMYQPMNQVMFGGTDALPPADQLNRIADAAVDMFLAAYGPLPERFSRCCPQPGYRSGCDQGPPGGDPRPAPLHGPGRHQDIEPGVRGYDGDREHRRPPRPAQAPPHADDHPHDGESKPVLGGVRGPEKGGVPRLVALEVAL